MESNMKDRKWTDIPDDERLELCRKVIKEAWKNEELRLKTTAIKFTGAKK